MFVTVTGDDVIYIEGNYDGVSIIDGNFTIEDSDHPSYVTNTEYASYYCIAN